MWRHVLVLWRAIIRHAPPGPNADIFEVTYVDDEAAFVAATSAKALMTSILIFMKCLCEAFNYFGFRINWGPGKTECFLSFRGQRAADHRRAIAASGNCIPLPDIPDVPSLRVVTSTLAVFRKTLVRPPLMLPIVCPLLWPHMPLLHERCLVHFHLEDCEATTACLTLWSSAASRTMSTYGRP